MIEIYTDGACKGDGSGGFGIVVVKDEELIHMSRGWSKNTTHNRMELKAILIAKVLYGLKEEGELPVCYSDSKYSVQTLSEWALGWRDNGWVKSDGEVPKNLDLIQKYLDSPGTIDLKWIRGHAGHKYNELADKLATGTPIKEFIELLPKDICIYNKEGINFELTF